MLIVDDKLTIHDNWELNNFLIPLNVKAIILKDFNCTTQLQFYAYIKCEDLF